MSSEEKGCIPSRVLDVVSAVLHRHLASLHEPAAALHHPETKDSTQEIVMGQGGGQALGLGEGFTGSGRLGLSVTEDGAVPCVCLVTWSATHKQWCLG